MSRIFITGSSDGLGLAAARTLAADGHDVVLHARSSKRAAAIDLIATAGAKVVIGDLGSAEETRALADQVNTIGRMDAVIHNAGVYQIPNRERTPDGHAKTLAVNTLAPYLLTALIERPSRLIYLSSGMHRSADATLRDIDWVERRWDATRAYCESKLYLTALAMAIARRWTDVASHAVDPGWVPTKMGGAGAPDDLRLGHLTQTWLAVSDDAAAKTSGGYWYHRKRQEPKADALDIEFQERLLAKLTELTGVALFEV